MNDLKKNSSSRIIPWDWSLVCFLLHVFLPFSMFCFLFFCFSLFCVSISKPLCTSSHVSCNTSAQTGLLVWDKIPKSPGRSFLVWVWRARVDVKWVVGGCRELGENIKGLFDSGPAKWFMKLQRWSGFLARMDSWAEGYCSTQSIYPKTPVCQVTATLLRLHLDFQSDLLHNAHLVKASIKRRRNYDDRR